MEGDKAGMAVRVKTVSSAVAGALESGALLEESGEAELSRVPASVASTFTLKVQEPFAATVPPLRDKLVSPWVGRPEVKVHVSLTWGGSATWRPVGKLSLKARPVSATESGLETVKVTEVT